MDKLLFRNQFVLGPHYIHSFDGWNGAQINGRIFITSHPNLNICQVSSGPKSITLMGYIIDPRNPGHDDRTILNELLHQFDGCRGLIKKTYPLGGRWVLVLKDERGLFLLNDATGLRQVFYADIAGEKEIWCASQPSLLASMLNLKKDGEALQFINFYSKRNREFWLPGDASLFRGIRHLLPNHYLDLKSGHAFRFWPDCARKDISPEAALQKTSGLLTGLIRGAFNRFELVLSLTAGLDSRLVLAASKEIKDGTPAMTIQKGRADFADVRVPSVLAKKLGLRHHILKPAEKVRDDFRSIYERNALYPHDAWVGDAQAIWDYNAGEKVAMTGSAAEIGRCWYPRYRKLEVTPRRLSMMKGMKHRFAALQFGNWLEGLRDGFNYHPLDLFCWEQGAGNWLAMCQLEFDIAWKDIFTPFNCRELLITLLAVSESYRKPPGYELQKRMILDLWPEVLEEAINPHKKKSFLEEIEAGIKFKLQDFKYTVRDYA